MALRTMLRIQTFWLGKECPHANLIHRNTERVEMTNSSIIQYEMKEILSCEKVNYLLFDSSMFRGR